MIAVLYIVGIFMTGATIWTALDRYLEYPSRNVIRVNFKNSALSFKFDLIDLIILFLKETESPASFPKILICTTSMHSRQKIHQLYSNFSTEALKALYG